MGGDARATARARRYADGTEREARSRGSSTQREGYGGAVPLRSSTTAELTFLKCNLRVSLLTSAATLRVKYKNKVLRGKQGTWVGASASD